MSSTARGRILERLKSALGDGPAVLSDVPDAPVVERTPEERVERLKTLMAAIRTEVHVVPADGFAEALTGVLREKGVKSLVYGPGSPIGPAVEAAVGSGGEGMPELIAYDKPIESFKAEMFAYDAGITFAEGGTADTGAIILNTGPDEPRLTSLVPPIHLAVLNAADIHDDLATAMEKMNWSDGMPTNMLLISGPSKTADIEFVLAFGVHGPKEVVLFIRT